MGVSLSKAAQWTTFSPDAGKLKFTPTNQALLKEILSFLERIVSQHPQEADCVFEAPLQWRTTSLAPDPKTDNDISVSTARSHEANSEGALSPPTAHSFSQLSRLIHAAEDKKLEEIQACLEENRNFLVKILGRRFASQLIGDDSDAESLKKDETSDVKSRLMVLLQNTDEQILRELLRDVSDAQYDPDLMKVEMDFLQFCSEGDDRLLKSVRYTSDFEYWNGCRAPPWRQAQGEICYVVIEPMDTERLSVTCCTAGVFLNGGGNPEEDDGCIRTSEIYPDLVTLMKRRSSYFALNLVKEVPYLPSAQRTQLSVSKLHDSRTLEPRWRDLLLSTGGGEEEKKLRRSSAEKKKRLESGTRSKTKPEVIVSSSPARLTSLTKKTSSKATVADFSSETSSKSEEEEEQPERRPKSDFYLSSEFLQIKKLVKYLKKSDQKVTLLVLCCMLDLDLTQESCNLVIRDEGGLKVLLNLLDTNEDECKMGALKILIRMSRCVPIQRSIEDMLGVRSFVNNLDSEVTKVKALAAETIANVANFPRSRRTVRQSGGIEKLIKLLDGFLKSQKKSDNSEDMEAARCGALALWSCSRSTRNKKAICKAGGIPLLGCLLTSSLESMLIPVVGTLQECASEESSRITIQSKDIIQNLVKNLRSDSTDLKIQCSMALFKCAEDKETRDLVRKYKGLKPLVELLNTNNKELLAAASGAIWKCSISSENVVIFQQDKVLESLSRLLTDQPEEVLINVAGALTEFLQIPANKAAIRKCDGIKPMIQLLLRTNQALLVNVTKAVGACATDKENRKIIDELDGISLLWALLQNPNPDVQSSAAWAICPCIDNSKDAMTTVLSFQGFGLILNLLTSTNKEVLVSTCAVIAKLAKYKNILTTLTEYGIVSLLTKLTNTKDDRLRHHLSDAICNCCQHANNVASFGEAGAVEPLVKYMKSEDVLVRQSATMALFQLSWDPNNNLTMLSKGAVKRLIPMIGSTLEEVQEAAACCVRNIRMTAMECRRASRISRPTQEGCQ
ncbi:armadillo repeat-containing protein 4 [Oryzias melastigma]|uniref:Outer dynein arm docking complex subunit 2 n=1 Tax=Oryzias melastigma TaxID=30732 RepID=A0A3B3CM10_ORYME|nr:armadillo repeat-containing protein 4 [Oryzias melastigma]XP_024136394.1 armadillo repeat-containing protein 4 [Oryzias melastigma]